MQSNNYEGKTKIEAINKAMNELNAKEDELVIEILEENVGIIKKVTRIRVTLMSDLITFLKEKLKEITKQMGLEVNFEVRKREQSLSIKMFSNNNNILIGKGGKTIESLQTIIRQAVSNEIKTPFSIILDVEDYKEKRVRNIEYLARRIAKEVAQTHIEVKLDSMNSYERRIIHEVLSKDRYVYTESVGEEPNRCIVVKPKGL